MYDEARTLAKATDPVTSHEAATGSNLLRQCIDLQRALEGACDVSRLAELMRSAA